MFINQGNAVRVVLKYCKVPSSTWYKRQLKNEKDGRSKNKGRPIPGYTINPDNTIVLDSSAVKALRVIRSRVFFTRAGGYHKLTKYIRRDYGFYINHKKIYRLCTENGLLLPKKKKQKRRGKKICENRKVTGPNQLWQFDIKYGYIHGENRFFFLMAFIDVFTREIRDYHIGLCCKASDIIFTLENALKKHRIDESNLVIRSDNGTQMTSHMFKKFIESKELEHEFTPPSTPNLNAFIESFFSIVETELFQANIFESYGEAYEKTILFIKHYNENRIHGSLDYKTPNEFGKSWTEKEELRQKELRA
ncbi:MAG: IS3 family transposase [Deltaproteobacteria bacterium]|nr:MAG: IS3 family transposase [Deltaproteobacteria bacterium]